MTFIDVEDGEEEKVKESYINEIEAQTLLDYYVNFIQKSESFTQEKHSLFIVSPFRTQAHAIRQFIQDKGFNGQILQEKLKKKAQDKEVFQKIDGVGCLEDLVSGGYNLKDDEKSSTFNIVMVSLCKSKPFDDQNISVLNSPEIVQLIKSKFADQLIVFGNSQSLNDLWREQVYDVSQKFDGG